MLSKVVAVVVAAALAIGLMGCFDGNCALQGVQLTLGLVASFSTYNVTCLNNESTYLEQAKCVCDMFNPLLVQASDIAHNCEEGTIPEETLAILENVTSLTE